jgi:hypothetical protein
MGAPTSSLLPEVFLQNLEHNSICKILVENKVVAYFRYVDDILIVYDKQQTDITHLLALFNNLHPKLTFTMELEEDMKVNFLDLTIHRLPAGVYVSIYRKPTASGSLIHFESCHPLEHKLAGINYLVNRIAFYPIPVWEKEKEIRISQQIINSNGYQHIDIAKLVKDRLLKSNSRCERNLGEDKKGIVKKWSSFSYIGKEVMPIARILRKFNINVALKTRNTAGKWLKRKHVSSDVDNGEKHDACGVYKIKCRSCSSVYTGQTGRSFNVRFREHISDIVHNRCKTGYSQNILNSGHERAHSITELEILERQHKRPFLNTL